MWQQLVDETSLNLVSVAADVQGPDVVRPWTDGAAATFTTLIDTRGELTGRLGLKAVPLILAFEDGLLVQPASSIDVLDDAHADAVRAWASGHTEQIALPALPNRTRSRDTELAAAWLSVARFAIEEGRLDDAVAALERGFQHDPDNRLIRKQRWALNEPDRFYAGDIDFAWQAEQQAAGR